MKFTCHSGVAHGYGPTVSAKAPLGKTASQQMNDTTELEPLRQQRISVSNEASTVFLASNQNGLRRCSSR